MIGGLVCGAVLLHIPREWIVVGVFIMLGISILAAVKVTRRKDVGG